jgi:hypothetical protein
MEGGIMNGIILNTKEFKTTVIEHPVTKEVIRYEEESGYIHIANDCFQFEHAQAVLNACDIAVSENKHDVWVTINNNYQIHVPNTSFLSAVLTKLLHNNRQ